MLTPKNVTDKKPQALPATGSDSHRSTAAANAGGPPAQSASVNREEPPASPVDIVNLGARTYDEAMTIAELTLNGGVDYISNLVKFNPTTAKMFEEIFPEFDDFLALYGDYDLEEMVGEIQKLLIHYHLPPVRFREHYASD